MRMQVGRVVAAVAVVGAVISGCGGPGQAGSAVIVGDDVVPLERVQSQLDTAMAKPEHMAQVAAQGGTTADVARGIVSSEVMHELLERRAAEEGVVVTDAQVDAYLAENGGAEQFLEHTRFDLPTLRERLRDELIAAELGRRAVAGLAVTADLVATTSREDALAKAQTLAAGGPAADALFGDPRTSARGNTYRAATQPANATTVLFGVPVGTVVAFQPNPGQSTWIVFRVTDRRTDAPADPAAVSNIGQSELIGIGQRLLQPTGEQLGITVNPRYGVWDPIQLRVVAEDQQAGVILPPATVAVS